MIEQQNISEESWLRWILQGPLTPLQIADQAVTFCQLRIEMGDEVPMAYWLARNAAEHSIDELQADIRGYLPREKPPRREVRIDPAFQSQPEVRYTPLSSGENGGQLLEMLIQEIEQRRGVTPPQNTQQIVRPQPENKPQPQAVPVAATRPEMTGWTLLWRGCVTPIIWAITLCLAVLATYVIINTLSRWGLKRDIGQSVRVFYATTFGGIDLNKDGEFLALEDGELTFYTYQINCAPGFRAVAAEGALLPPPVMWPEQDVEVLIESEYLGCLPWTRYQQVRGYWDESVWAVLALQDTDIVEEFAPDGADKNGKELQAWMPFALYGVSAQVFKDLKSTDLSKAGAVGQTGGLQPAPLPVESPVPTVFQPQPTMKPWIDPNAGQQQAPAAPPAAPPVQPTAPPVFVPTEEPPLPAAAPEQNVPYMEAPPPTAIPFATQTPQPIVMPSQPPKIHPTLMPLSAMPTSAIPTVGQAKNTTVEGVAYSAECIALFDKYQDKTDNTPIPTADFVGMANCRIKGHT